MFKGEKHQPYFTLKQTLELQGVGIKDLANVLKKSPGTIRCKLNGRSDFFISEQQKICEAFALHPDIFFDNIVAKTITKKY